MVSSAGAVIDHVVYDSFGNIMTETNASNGDRFKFAGMQYDPTDGRYFDRARWYQNSDGRFLSPDPLGFLAGDSDLYRYIHNAATAATDPSGEIEPVTAILLIAGEVLLAASGCGGSTTVDASRRLTRRLPSGISRK